MSLNTAHVFHRARFMIKYIVESSWNKDVNTLYGGKHFPKHLWLPLTVRVSETSKSRAVARVGPWLRAPPVWWRLKKIKFCNYLLLWNSILCPWWKVQITVVPSHLKLFPAINFNSYEHLNIYWGGGVKRRISVGCRMSVYSSAKKIRSRQAS